MSSNPIAPQKKPDLYLIRGDSAAINFEIDMDITGCTVFFTARLTLPLVANDTDAAIHVVVTSHTDPTNGKTVIPLTPTDTNVAPGTYYYDIQVVKDANTVVSIPPRKLIVGYDISRSTT